MKWRALAFDYHAEASFLAWEELEAKKKTVILLWDEEDGAVVGTKPAAAMSDAEPVSTVLAAPSLSYRTLRTKAPAQPAPTTEPTIHAGITICAWPTSHMECSPHYRPLPQPCTLVQAMAWTVWISYEFCLRAGSHIPRLLNGPHAAEPNELSGHGSAMERRTSLQHNETPEQIEVRRPSPAGKIDWVQDDESLTLASEATQYGKSPPKTAFYPMEEPSVSDSSFHFSTDREASPNHSRSADEASSKMRDDHPVLAHAESPSSANLMDALHDTNVTISAFVRRVHGKASPSDSIVAVDNTITSDAPPLLDTPAKSQSASKAAQLTTASATPGGTSITARWMEEEDSFIHRPTQLHDESSRHANDNDCKKRKKAERRERRAAKKARKAQRRENKRKTLNVAEISSVPQGQNKHENVVAVNAPRRQRFISAASVQTWKGSPGDKVDDDPSSIFPSGMKQSLLNATRQPRTAASGSQFVQYARQQAATNKVFRADARPFDDANHSTATGRGALGVEIGTGDDSEDDWQGNEKAGSVVKSHRTALEKDVTAMSPGHVRQDEQHHQQHNNYMAATHVRLNEGRSPVGAPGLSRPGAVTAPSQPRELGPLQDTRLQNFGTGAAHVTPDTECPPLTQYSRGHEVGLQGSQTSPVLFCSESFLETWSDIVGELYSGRWMTAAGLQSDNKRLKPSLCAIDLRDTTLMNKCGVDIELPGRSAALVYTTSAFEDPSKARQAIKDVVQLASVGRYANVVVFVCYDSHITRPVQTHILQMQTAALRHGVATTVQYQMCSIETLPAMIADLALRSSRAMPAWGDAATLVDDDGNVARAAFLLSIIPTLSAMGALQLLQAAKVYVKKGSYGTAMQCLLRSPHVRKHIMVRALSGQAGTTEIHPAAMLQLTQALSAPLLQHGASTLS